MNKTMYGVGDHVFLLSGPLRTGRTEGEFTIVTRLPDVHGAIQYRVKSNSENFERRIVSSDIDLERSPKPRGDKEKSPVTTQAKGSWLKASPIKSSK